LKRDFNHYYRLGRDFFAAPGIRKCVPVLSLVTAMFLWGGSFIALKIAFRAYDPMVVIFGRMAVATACFALFWPRLKREKIRKADIKPILLMGIFEPCLYFIFEARAIVYTTASQAGMITAMLPLMVALAAVLILGERLRFKTLLGFTLALAGAVVLSVTGEAGSAYAPNPPLGNFFEFLAMVSATFYTISVKKLSERHSAFFLTAVQALIGALFFGLFLFFPGTRLPGHVDTGAITAVLYLGAVVTMGAYFLYNYGVSQMPASRASAFVNLIPVFTLFLGRLILGETFTPMQFIASGLIFTGVLLSQR
jgi:drug/metabolite transporter (DMT)-like permease